MDFAQVIDEKIKSLQNDRDVLAEELSKPQFHIDRITQLINEVIPRVEALDVDIDSLKNEFISVLSQIPSAVLEGWSSHLSDIKDLNADMQKYSEMKNLYASWKKEQNEALEREQHLKEEIASGEIKEPSRTTGRKRKPGEKPPITLGRYRSITDEGEDQQG